MTIYKDTSFTKKVVTLKAGQKFKTFKYKKDKNGEFKIIYIKNKDAVKDWISTKDIPDYEYIIRNLLMWG